MSSANPLVILGAGISGLALAQGLLKLDIPFRVFERDTSLSFRAQGYRIRISSHGIKGLEYLLPADLFARLRASCPEFLAHSASFNAVTGENIPTARPPHHEDIEPLTADRTVLRNILLRGLEPYIQFGKEFDRYEAVEDSVILHFTDGTSFTSGYLIGADGGRSRLRRQFLPDHQIFDTEGRLIYGKTILTPDIEEVVGPEALKGLTVIRETGLPPVLGLLLEPLRFKSNEFRSELPKDYIYWVMMARKDILAKPDADIMALSPEEVEDFTRQLTSEWHSSFKSIMDHQAPGETAYLPVLSVKPDSMIRTFNPGDEERITLIGDAAHLKTPAGGIGATTALRDAHILAIQLREGGLNARSFRPYEKAMKEYAVEALALSGRGGKILMGMKDWSELEAVKV